MNKSDGGSCQCMKWRKIKNECVFAQVVLLRVRHSSDRQLSDIINIYEVKGVRLRGSLVPEL